MAEVPCVSLCSVYCFWALGLKSNIEDYVTLISYTTKNVLNPLYYLVPGGWSSWSVAKPCSVSCGSGIEILSRSCTNPSPQHGGKSCSGKAQKQQACSRNPCPSMYSLFNIMTWLFCEFHVKRLSRMSFSLMAVHTRSNATWSHGAPKGTNLLSIPN